MVSSKDENQHWLPVNFDSLRRQCIKNRRFIYEYFELIFAPDGGQRFFHLPPHFVQWRCWRRWAVCIGAAGWMRMSRKREWVDAQRWSVFGESALGIEADLGVTGQLNKFLYSSVGATASCLRPNLACRRRVWHLACCDDDVSKPLVEGDFDSLLFDW